jgi:Transposase DDE domain
MRKIGVFNASIPAWRPLMAQSTSGRLARQFDHLRTALAQQPGLPFADLLPADADTTLGATPEPVYSPLVTAWLFLTQVLDPDGSCRQAVARLLAWRSATGQSPCAAGTGAYCKARQRLPEDGLHALVRSTGRTLHDRAAPTWHWCGRRVTLVDGSTVSLPDTPANQHAYPQPDGQRPGLGFPMVRFVVLFCLATGAVLEAALCPYRGKGTGEVSLLRQVWDALDPGDVLLGDRIFCSYFEIALLQHRGIDVVVRKHQSRRTDFRCGQRLGPQDHRITWAKPRCPDWLDEAAYVALPATLTVRELRVQVRPPGFRVRQYEVITTLLDPAGASAAALAALYRQRWHAELDLRSLKAALRMDRLRCRTPAMARKELWAHLLAYNLVRGVMAQAAHEHRLTPRQVSFTGAVQTLLAFGPMLTGVAPAERSIPLRQFWAAVAAHRVGDRPDRLEPRALKRRRRPYAPLTEPRNQARQRLFRAA